MNTKPFIFTHPERSSPTCGMKQQASSGEVALFGSQQAGLRKLLEQRREAFVRYWNWASDPDFKPKAFSLSLMIGRVSPLISMS